MTRLERIAEIEKRNLKCAQIIVADPVKYPGIMQEWAQLVIAKAAKRDLEWRLTA
jgi:hypothetical protein